MNAPQPPLCISATEAARILGVSRWTVYELARKGEIPTRSLGRRILIDREPFLDYVAALPSAAEAAS